MMTSKEKLKIKLNKIGILLNEAKQDLNIKRTDLIMLGALNVENYTQQNGLLCLIENEDSVFYDDKYLSKEKQSVNKLNNLYTETLLELGKVTNVIKVADEITIDSKEMQSWVEKS